jgi:hypothetical protein
VLRQKTGAKRLEIASRMFASARRMLAGSTVTIFYGGNAEPA